MAKKVVKKPEEAQDVRPLMVWVCDGCFTGSIPVPPIQRGKYVDNGFDFFYDSQPVKQNHKCTGERWKNQLGPGSAELLLWTFPGGSWKDHVINLPTALYAQIIKAGGAGPGPVTTDKRDWKD